MEIPVKLPLTKLGLPNLENLSLNKIFLAVLVASVLLGALGGYLMIGSSAAKSIPIVKNPTTAGQDNRTFRDFAEGTVQKRPEPKDSSEYIEGTHMLVRPGATSVALTSSVVDLSQYEGKSVKVFGETQKAIKEGWLMDVGKVEVK